MSVIDIEHLLAPISDAQPTGDDARYEFCYEMMEAEVKKFGSLSGETVDWSVVKTHAIEVLERQSKDIKAMCYLTRALAEEFGLEGFKQGMALLNESLIRFGNALYPSRVRTRDGAVEWLNHQFKLISGKFKFESSSWELLSDTLVIVEKLQQQYDEHNSNAGSDFFQIRSLLNGMVQQCSNDGQIASDTQLKHHTQNVKEETADTHAQTALEKSVPPQKMPPTAKEGMSKPIGEVVVQQNAVREEINIDTDFSTPIASRQTLKKVAEVMINANPKEPLAYRVFRHLTWQNVFSLPDHNSENVTLINFALSLDIQGEYREKAKNEGDIATIKSLELILTDIPFWFTGHYFIYSMLNNLGFDEAAKAVKQETQRFVASLDGIERLSFKNSIPFADETTLRWLATKESASSTSSSVVQTVVVSQEDTMPMDDITLENLGEYAAELSRRLELDDSGRGQFMLYLRLIAAYQSVGLYPLCLPYLEKGWEVQKVFDLASWEPHLSIQLEDLIRITLLQLFKSKDLVPAKYDEWKAFYDE